MLAIVCREKNGIEALRLEELPTPALTPGCIRVQMKLASVNYPDYLMASGRYQVNPPTPFVLGIEGSGTVVESAPEVVDFVPGDRVMVYAGQGCFASETVVSTRYAHKVPDGMDDEIAVGFLLAYGTSYHGLVGRGRLRDGETLVVLGAAGGLGSSATHIGKALGATVIAVAGSDSKLDFCRSNGADYVIDSRSGSIRDRLRELTGGRGPEIVYDVVGGDLTEVMLRSIAAYGRLLIVGYASGSIPEIKGNLVLLKQADVIGVSFRQYFQQYPESAGQDLERLCDIWRAGKLRVTPATVMPFGGAVEALKMVAQRRAVGKLAFRMSSS